MTACLGRHSFGAPWGPAIHDDDGRPLKAGTDLSDTDLGIELEYLIDGVCNQERFLQLQQARHHLVKAADLIVKGR